MKRLRKHRAQDILAALSGEWWTRTDEELEAIARRLRRWARGVEAFVRARRLGVARNSHPEP